MLVFGDYVFIPFAFSVQCHYLLDYPDYTSPLLAIPFIALYLVGYYIFRTSNSQKINLKLILPKRSGARNLRLLEENCSSLVSGDLEDI